MRIAIKKVDKRMRAIGHFEYVVVVDGKNATTSFKEALANYKTVLHWCNHTWGESIALTDTTPSNMPTTWSWHNDLYIRQIYLKSEKELTWFHLRWCGQVSR